MTRPVVLLALAAVVAQGLAAQGDVRARLEGRVPPEIAAAVSALADSARARGLPTRLLVDKALEGAVKGVAADRILPAVRMELHHLDAAATALRGSVGSPAPDAVEAGAFAIGAGLTAEDVGEIARTADRSYSTAVALQVAGALAALGVPRAQTVGLVGAEIRSGRPVGDLLSLPGQIQAAMAGGSMPAAAAGGLERAAAAHQAPRPQGQGKGTGNPHKP